MVKGLSYKLFKDFSNPKTVYEQIDPKIPTFHSIIDIFLIMILETMFSIRLQIYFGKFAKVIMIERKFDEPVKHPPYTHTDFPIKATANKDTVF